MLGCWSISCPIGGVARSSTYTLKEICSEWQASTTITHNETLQDGGTGAAEVRSWEIEVRSRVSGVADSKPKAAIFASPGPSTADSAEEVGNATWPKFWVVILRSGSSVSMV